ncbi:GNAT family N-acetyltransferase [Candidatus Hamiltonella defensa]|uniref:Acetyltransferase n=3 Tax=Candidatus Williamhamiltonella defendens TaxID=138072 RepID=C4K820_HAMD5|nr:GNAT family N-acetyltransferase [Candidatus Hamiltonella defensa]ACQ68713.1 putative acetyltransferase [Candidatus Hamiltonella defensa 5AT (Acyrthosiphon pisum)]ATW23244.1 hypothetical protein BJP44_09595 [Candidatus Hamiltonella defensa]
MLDKRNDRGDILRFRLSTPVDIGSLAALRWKLCTDDSPVTDSSARKKFIAAFQSALMNIEEQGRFVPFVAESNSQIVAVLSIIKVAKIPHPDDINGQWGYLTNVYTLPEFRNKGTGGRLLAEAKNWAEAQQLELLVVWPSDKSYAFYERAGFRREADPLVLKL